MPYRRTPAVQARLDAQRDTILSAAAELLAEGGYGSCTVSAVARRAGVASGTVYRYFDTKADLAGDLFRVVAGREVEAVRAAVAGRATAADRVGAVVETFARRALRQPRRAYALLAEPVDPTVDALRLEFRVAFRDVLAAAITDGIATGELPPQPVDVAAAALVGAIAEALVGPLAEPAAADADAIVPALTEFTHRAIGGLVHADT